ncbi:hypothetical protein MXB_1879 [Myxobolus squamalis]|nr:hypothetical protein MXB_1879 [Myxobolus squamalis]
MMHVTIYEGYIYHPHSISNDIESIYKCANYQLEKCFARLIIKQIEIIQSGNHSCKINCNIEDKNIENEIEKYISSASKDLSKYPNQIFQKLLCFFNEK